MDRGGESHMETGTEIGGTQPEAKEHLEPPEARRSKGGFSSRTFRGSAATTLTVDSWSRTGRQ